MLNAGRSIALIAAGAIAACSAATADYQSMSPEKQQAHLDSVAKGIKAGFPATAGGVAQITYLTADADADIIALDMKITDSRAENASYAQAEKMKQTMQEQSCVNSAVRDLFKIGVTLKLRILRPSGANLATVSLSE
jgi:hypothetical protein